ncbi:hypothetical protein CDAR_561701, partial [Caerostris darwini]
MPDVHLEEATIIQLDIEERERNIFVYFSLFQKLHWVFGHNTNVTPINISTSTVKAVFFTSGAIGVYYNWIEKTQMMFFGHSNDIISSAATTDKIYLASADYGPKNALIIWHAKSGNIAFTMSNKYPDGGVIWMCFSEDNNMLLTLSGEIPQDEGGIISSVVNLTSLYDE